MKSFPNQDFVQQSSFVRERVYIKSRFFRLGYSPSTHTGTVTYRTDDTQLIKTFNHWESNGFSGSYYHTIYDRNFTSPAATPLFDIAFGVSVSSSLSGEQEYLSGNCNFYPQKNKMYRLYAQRLLGDANKFFVIAGERRDELLFLNLRRTQIKNGIVPETLDLIAGISGSADNYWNAIALTDKVRDDISFGGRVGDIVVKSPGWQASEDNVNLYYENEALGYHDELANNNSGLSGAAGLIYYNHGILILVPELFSDTISLLGNNWFFSGGVSELYDEVVTNDSGSGLSLDDTIEGMRQRIHSIEYVNELEMKSTFFECVAENHEFNYSNNPTFKNDKGEIRITSLGGGFKSTTYITRVGLLGQNKEVLAMGQLSRPVKKDPNLEVKIVVRLDF